jgi:hypothetical protein
MALAENSPGVWVPVCCGRVMRYNTFRQPGGGMYGALVCTICSKNVVLEQEPLSSVDAYGEGSSVLNVLGSPKPPKTERRKPTGGTGSDEPTL